MNNKFYSNSDSDRVSKTPVIVGENKYRTGFSRDYSRLVHSPSFRRLNGKTQLFPGRESDFFRNRLTHSIEVADIAKSITNKVNQVLIPKAKIKGNIDLDLVQFASLAHDLGHPPFGHIGEKALDNCMKRFGRFEGNAQTLRLLAKIEKKEVPSKYSNSIMEYIKNYGFVNKTDNRIGLNLTYRSLAAILKYPTPLENVSSDTDKEFKKGYYKTEHELVESVKKNICQQGDYFEKYWSDFKTIECSIMDLSDDIAYTTYDLEDAFKANFVNFLDFFDQQNSDLWKGIIGDVNKAIKKYPEFGSDGKVTELYCLSKEAKDKRKFMASIQTAQKYILGVMGKFIPEITDQDRSNLNKDPKNTLIRMSDLLYQSARLNSENGFSRTEFSTTLVRAFIDKIKLKINSEVPALSQVYLEYETFLSMEFIKKFIYHSQINSSKLQIVEFRGKEIVSTIFNELYNKGNCNYKLLPNDYRLIYEAHLGNATEETKARHICDFVSGMTDDYALTFYARLKSENAETIFRPF